MFQDQPPLTQTGPVYSSYGAPSQGPYQASNYSDYEVMSPRMSSYMPGQMQPHTQARGKIKLTYEQQLQQQQLERQHYGMINNGRRPTNAPMYPPMGSQSVRSVPQPMIKP